ncbi:hypothetical protein EV122DRAFT_274003 [Schizophyllum commune]
MSLAEVEHLHSTALFLPADVAHARKAVESRIALVDEDIDFLRKAVAGLEEQKRRLLRRVDIYNAYEAPVRCLPAEMLSEIFYNCCVAFDDITSKDSCMPLVLGAPKILRIQVDGLTLPPANEPDTITVSFLKFIKAPRLELLSISWRSGSTLRTLDTPTPEDVDFLATFQANSAPPLHELQLVCPHIRVRDWAFSVTSLRALILRLDDMAPFDDECAALLTDVSDGSLRLLPHLERFYLIGEIHASGESLLRMVQKRAEVGSGLRVLHLDIRTTSMRKLGKLGSLDLIRQTVPYARIEGDVLAKYHAEQERLNTSNAEGTGMGHEFG